MPFINQLLNQVQYDNCKVEYVNKIQWYEVYTGHKRCEMDLIQAENILNLLQKVLKFEMLDWIDQLDKIRNAANKIQDRYV